MIAGQIINGLMVGGLYALIAVGFTLIVGVLHRINFAHTEVFMVGGFVGLVIAQAVPSIPLAMVGAFVVGGVLGIDGCSSVVFAPFFSWIAVFGSMD